VTNRPEASLDLHFGDLCERDHLTETVLDAEILDVAQAGARGCIEPDENVELVVTVPERRCLEAVDRDSHGVRNVGDREANLARRVLVDPHRNLGPSRLEVRLHVDDVVDVFDELFGLRCDTAERGVVLADDLDVDRGPGRRPSLFLDDLDRRADDSLEILANGIDRFIRGSDPLLVIDELDGDSAAMGGCPARAEVHHVAIPGPDVGDEGRDVVAASQHALGRAHDAVARVEIGAIRQRHVDVDPIGRHLGEELDAVVVLAVDRKGPDERHEDGDCDDPAPSQRETQAGAVGAIDDVVRQRLELVEAVDGGARVLFGLGAGWCGPRCRWVIGAQRGVGPLARQAGIGAPVGVLELGVVECPRRSHEERADHGVDDEGHEEARAQNDDHRHGQVVHELAHDAWPQHHWGERSHRRRGRCDHRPGDLAGPVPRRLA